MVTDLSKRNKANKRRGAGFEIDMHEYLAKIFPTERLTKKGREDEGDLVLRITSDTALIVECKNEAAITLSSYVQEAKVEALNYQAHRVHDVNYPEHAIGVAIVKRRNSGIDKSYAVMEVSELVELILCLRGG